MSDYHLGTASCDALADAQVKALSQYGEPFCRECGKTESQCECAEPDLVETQSPRTERSVPPTPHTNRALPVEGLKKRLVPTKVGGHRNSAGGVEGHAEQETRQPRASQSDRQKLGSSPSYPNPHSKCCQAGIKPGPAPIFRRRYGKRNKAGR